MSRLDDAVFTFVSDALAADTFDVLRFSGTEGLSALYEFNVLLISSEQDIDPTAVLQGTVTFGIKAPFAPEGGLEYKGILSGFEQLQRLGERYVYRARLRHKFWWLSLIRQNRVFLDVSPVEAVNQILAEAGLNQGADFAWKCRETYAKREFICQYDETDLAFISRWLERLGICYWFAHGPAGACCNFTDASMAHTTLPGNESCRFAEATGLVPDNPGQVIADFVCHCRPLPKEVRYKSYNPQKPDLDLTCTAPVRSDGRGVFYRYGDNYADPDEGAILARNEAQALLCRAEIYTGISHNPALRPGYTFSLQRHFRSAWNRAYLTTAVRHEGSQARLLVRAYGLQGLDDADRLHYRNSFECIPASTQFRPARATPWPRVAGVVPAKVDGQGSGQYAELDEQGRYKVILPFDASGRGGGKASCWLRMMQPFAGEGMGFHAPLHKGTEVMVGFVDGDPDRPVIMAAVPNPVTPSPVTDANATQIALHSATGQKIRMEDAQGQEHILLSSADGGTYFKIGKI